MTTASKTNFRRLQYSVSALFLALGGLSSHPMGGQPAHADTTSLHACGGLVSVDLVDVERGAPVSMAEVVAQASQNQAVLIGERHGVAEHPMAAACLMALLAEQKPVALVAEMVAVDQQHIVDDYRSKHPEISGGLGAALKWWESGWPNWSTYMPVFDAAWRLRIPVVAGDAAESGEAAPRDLLQRVLKSDIDAVLASWAQSMRQAHCGILDDERAEQLARRQVGRDIVMSRQLQAASAALRRKNTDSEPVTILYAGRAHIREDRSVGLILRAQLGLDPVTIYLHEVSEHNGPVDRAEVIRQTADRADYVWFVGRVEKPDACERLRRRGLIAGVPGETDQ